MATDNTVQLTGQALEDYLERRFSPPPTITVKETPAVYSAEYFADLFADILADVGCGIPAQDKQVADNLMEGFELAIDQWLTYHEEVGRSYKTLHARFLGINRD